MTFPSPYQATTESATPSSIMDWFRQLRAAFTSFIKITTTSTVNLTTDQSYSAIIEINGTLGGAINVIVALLTKQWIFYNNTTGGFAITVKTNTGTGIAIAAGKRAIVYCDGTNVVRASPDT
jgi:hypothetical protein